MWLGIVDVRHRQFVWIQSRILNKAILPFDLGTSLDGVFRIAAVGAKVILSAVFLLLVSKRETKTGGGIW